MARRRSGIHGREGIAGWLFTAPMIIILGLFLLVPIVMALWVSLTNWRGNVNPFAVRPERRVRRREQLHALFTQDGLTRDTSCSRIGNNFYYVLLVVPLQTAVVARPRAGRQQQAAQGQELLPHRVLLPVGDQLDRDRDGLPVPVLQHRRGQRAARLRRHRRAAVVQRLPGPAAHRPRLVRRRGQPLLGRRATSSAGRLWDWLSGPVGGDVRHHHPGHLDDHGHLHADVPRGAAGPAGRDRRGGGPRRRPVVAEAAATSPCRCSSRRSSWS